jgi:hypothetical protein
MGLGDQRGHPSGESRQDLVQFPLPLRANTRVVQEIQQHQPMFIAQLPLNFLVHRHRHIGNIIQQNLILVSRDSRVPRACMINDKLVWDAAAMKITSSAAANQHVDPAYRAGWV